MRSNILVSCLTVVLSGWFTAAGAGETSRIRWDQADQHYNETCEVVGAVVTAKDIGSRTFLNFQQDYSTSFTVVINAESYGAFPKPPAKMYADQLIGVTGKIVEYRGKPEIIVTSPEQIRIVDPQEVASLFTQPKQPKTETPATPEPPSGATAASEKKEHKPARVPANGVVRVATFNTFNLFDNYDDPYVEHEMLPGKPEDQLAALARTIHKVDADVIALEEVENRPVLEHFAAKYLVDMDYTETVLIEGNNERGIDVGLLSRYPVGPVTSYRHESFPDANGEPMRFQRDLLRVNIRPPGYVDFDVFVVHLKSKYGGEEASLPLRLGEARKIRGLFDDILEANPHARFLICGDFNDTFESKPLQTLIGTGQYKLRTFFKDVPESERITYNKHYLSMIDFIFASPAMAADYRPGSYQVFMGTVETNGSDHNPVKADFKLEAAPEHN